MALPFVRGKAALGPGGKGVPPYLPDRPNLFDEVEWGPLATPEEAKLAYKIWAMQDECIFHPQGRTLDSPYRNTHQIAQKAETCLANNVYEKLLQMSALPLAKDQWDEWAQYRRTGNGKLKPWTYEEVFGYDSPTVEKEPIESKPTISLQGYNLNNKRFWTKAKLTRELRARNLSTEGPTEVLRSRLYEDELAKLGTTQDRKADERSKLPFDNLSQWGVFRKDKFALEVSRDMKFGPIDMYTYAILLCPYNPTYWNSRAFLHYQMGHFDLALGDAYRGQLLCDVLTNHSDRNSRPGLYARVYDAIEQHVLQTPRSGKELPEEIKKLRQITGFIVFLPTLSYSLQHIISLSLLGLRCYSDYYRMEPTEDMKSRMRPADRAAFEERWTGVKELVSNAKDLSLQESRDYFFESHYGSILTQPYPYDNGDVKRTDPKFVARISDDFLGHSQAAQAKPKIEILTDDSGELGVRATEDITAGEMIYADEPSIRGHLRASKLTPLEMTCENCKKQVPEIPDAEIYRLRKQQEMAIGPGLGPIVCACYESDTTPMLWCLPPEGRNINVNLNNVGGPPYSSTSSYDEVSQGQVRARDHTENHYGLKGGRSSKRVKREPAPAKPNPIEHVERVPRTCLEIARSSYHYRTCGRDWTWLHDAMRYDTWRHIDSHKGTTNVSFSHEKHGTVLSLLLREVFDITLFRRETDNRPNLYAHEIDELLPLMGSEGEEKFPFPFSFAANIQVPFDILQCLGVNIFRDLTFDTWVIQTVLRKLLVNAVPWDHGRRGIKDVPEYIGVKHERAGIGRIGTLTADRFPTFRNLYIFPGLSMFNHACPPENNATWDWGLKVPNRVIVWANKKIEKGQEIFLPYANSKLSNNTARRLFGDLCFCPGCESQDAALASPSISYRPEMDYVYGSSTTQSQSENESEIYEETELESEYDVNSHHYRSYIDSDGVDRRPRKEISTPTPSIIYVSSYETPSEHDGSIGRGDEMLHGLNQREDNSQAEDGEKENKEGEEVQEGGKEDKKHVGDDEQNEEEHREEEKEYNDGHTITDMTYTEENTLNRSRLLQSIAIEAETIEDSSIAQGGTTIVDSEDQPQRPPHTRAQSQAQSQSRPESEPEPQQQPQQHGQQANPDFHEHSHVNEQDVPTDPVKGPRVWQHGVIKYTNDLSSHSSDLHGSDPKSDGNGANSKQE